MPGERLSPARILEKLLPQQRPFRFVDEILEVDERRISGRYTFRPDEFYAGHFPGRPITPGVILLESMCQVGVVASALNLFVLEHFGRSGRGNGRTPFVEAESEVHAPCAARRDGDDRGERADLVAAQAAVTHRDVRGRWRAAGGADDSLRHRSQEWLSGLS